MSSPLEDALLHRAEGMDTAHTSEILVTSGVTPIAAIKAIREAFGIGLGEAKAIVHGCLSEEQQAAAERLWDEAESALRDID